MSIDEELSNLESQAKTGDLQALSAYQHLLLRTKDPLGLLLYAIVLCDDSITPREKLFAALGIEYSGKRIPAKLAGEFEFNDLHFLLIASRSLAETPLGIDASPRSPMPARALVSWRHHRLFLVCPMCQVTPSSIPVMKTKIAHRLEDIVKAYPRGYLHIPVGRVRQHALVHIPKWMLSQDPNRFLATYSNFLKDFKLRRNPDDSDALQQLLNTVREEFQDYARKYLDLDDSIRRQVLEDFPGIQARQGVKDHVDEFLSLGIAPQLWILTTAFKADYIGFSMLGIDDPVSIISDKYHLSDLFPTLESIKTYQKLVYLVLKENGWLEILRQQAIDDFNSPLDDEYHEFGTAWGVMKTYTLKILENFLTNSPNPEWI